MKLSDIKGERTFDVIAECIDPITNIAADPEASRLFKREILPAGKNKKEFIVEKIRSSVPKLLKNHKDDMVTILASINGVSKASYVKSLTMTTLMSDCIELITDEAFIGIFTSAQSETGVSSSGSVQVNTGAHTV